MHFVEGVLLGVPFVEELVVPKDYDLLGVLSSGVQADLHALA